MKNVRAFFIVTALLGLLLAGAGCLTTGTSTGSNANVTAPPGAADDSSGKSGDSEVNTTDLLSVGDPITITFSGPPDPPPAISERLKADGMIDLTYLKDPIKAVGKTRGELEEEIHRAYVPQIYRRLTVKVGAEGRYITVNGEVRQPGRGQYFRQMTVLRAIAAAGGFTDFANKRNVLVRRANGTEIRVNCLKALKDPKADIQVYPDDFIEVPRRIM